ncbi:MAG: hypothetical protein M1827_006803 [Pycnora praestabilis]|nr:MAG: hypothetical protein M1827_006803 [Pycnora praestabilis]
MPTFACMLRAFNNRATIRKKIFLFSSIALIRQKFRPKFVEYYLIPSSGLTRDRISDGQRRRASQQVGGYGGGQEYQIQPGQTESIPCGKEEHEIKDSGNSGNQWGPTFFKMFESAATTLASIAVLGLAGYAYHRYYKYLILKKMENAFRPGDPVLEMAALEKDDKPKEQFQGKDQFPHWIRRKEQDKIDGVVSGEDKGHYLLLVGEKGTGKSSMLIDAMRRVDGEGVSMFEAHADLEIFRVRLGKCLDYEFNEDYVGSLFSIKGQRDTTALLDIERAFNKLEKVALRRRRKLDKPLVLIVNSTHLLRNDEDGQDLLELIQQRAEQWAASNLVTVILNSDDYWVYERLKQYAARMEVLPVLDLPKDQALAALRRYRSRLFNEDTPTNILEHVYEKVGGRIAFLNNVAKSIDMRHTCEQILQQEKTWFLNKCWILGEEMDDDVMDEQKYASAAMVLAKALVDKEKEMQETYDPKKGHILPQIPLHEARQIMTRADFIQSYDQINVFTIDSKAMVRADSVPMQNAFREICAEPGFSDHLNATLERISAIESLGRTRELVMKDFQHGGGYRVTVENTKEGATRSMTFKTVPEESEEVSG